MERPKPLTLRAAGIASQDLSETGTTSSGSCSSAATSGPLAAHRT